MPRVRHALPTQTPLTIPIGINAIFKRLSPGLNSDRVCIKILATWEGLQACRALEAKGFTTLATAVCCMEQAALAADSNCSYAAVYITDLKEYSENG